MVIYSIQKRKKMNIALKNLKFIILSAVAFLGIIIPFILATTQEYHTIEKAITPQLLTKISLEQAAHDATIKLTDYPDLIKQEEKELWQELEEIGISQDDFERSKQEHAQDYEESVKRMKKRYASEVPLSAEMISLINETLKQFTIDPTSITIISSTLANAGASTDKALFINESLLKNYNQTTQQFALAHECTHMNNKDHSTRYHLKQLCTEKNHDTTSWQHPYNKMQHLHEMRADIMPCLKSNDYAQGCEQFYAMHMHAQGDYESADQPKSSLRLATATNILNMYKTV